MAPRKTSRKSTGGNDPRSPLAVKPKSTGCKTPRAPKTVKPKSTGGNEPRSPLAVKPKSTDGKAPRAPKTVKPKSTGGKAPRAPKTVKPKSTGGKAPRAPMVLETEPNDTDQIRVHFKLAHSLHPERKKHAHMRPSVMSPLNSVTLKVNSLLPIYILRIQLRPLLWIPFYEDFHLKRSRYRDTLYPGHSLFESGVKDKDTLLVVMEGFALEPNLYLRLLDERGESSFPLGGGPGDVIPEGEPQKLKVHFRLSYGLAPIEGSLRDSFILLVNPKLPIGLLKIRLRTLFWIRYSESLSVVSPLGVFLDDDCSTLDDYDVKDGDALLASLDNSMANKMQIFVKAAHYMDAPFRCPERSHDLRYIVRLIVQPTSTIGNLKSRLNDLHWIPRKNTVLFSFSKSEDSGISLHKDDTSTLNSCGIKDGDTLMACMDDGEFQIQVLDYGKTRSIPILVKSCFQNIGDLKMMIHKTKGYHPEDQILVSRANYVQNFVPLKDETPLAVLGIVKSFYEEMSTDILYEVMLRKPRPLV